MRCVADTRGLAFGLALWAVFLLGPAAPAQNDVRVAVLGGAFDDRAAALVPASGGGVHILGTSNSVESGWNELFVARLDAAGELVRMQTYPLPPFAVCVGGWEGESGRVWAVAVHPSDGGYGVLWQAIESDGSAGPSTTYATGSWDLPAAAAGAPTGAVTALTSYASGRAAAALLVHPPAGPHPSAPPPISLAASPSADFVAADVALSGTTAFLAATRYPEGASFDADSDAAVAQTCVYDTLTGATATWESPFPGTVAAAIDASPSGAILLMTRRLPPADPTDPAASPTYRLAMARLNADGSQAWFTTLPAGGDMAGRAVVWTVDGAQYATAAVTSAYGLGGPEVLYSRFNGSGTWGGGPTFGTPESDEPADLVRTPDGLLWILATSDGYTNGRPDLVVYRLASPDLGTPVLDVHLHVTPGTVGLPPAAPAPPPSLLHPNPTRDRASGLPDGAPWRLLDLTGRPLRTGTGPSLDLTGLPPGPYLVVPDGSGTNLAPFPPHRILLVE